MDYKYMRLALEEAKKASAKNEVPVGSVIVNKNNEILAKAHNLTISNLDVSSHSEILAIQNASKKNKNYRLLDTTIYVTMEPCIMCMGAIIHARISRLVFATFDKKWGACGSLYNFAKDKKLNHKIDISFGIFEDEAKTMIQKFFKKKRTLEIKK